MEKHTVSKLIGSPPGYVGYDEAGQLTEKIRRKPYSVVLFDEIEKAHPDVLNILLQVLDDGRITDAQGRLVNFENAIIVMTSNAGSEGNVSSLGPLTGACRPMRRGTMKALRSFLRPEFLNRVDEIITFNHLTRRTSQHCRGIMLGELKDSLANRELTFTWDESLVDYLVDKAYSVTYGARNLRRVLEQDVEDPISEKSLIPLKRPSASFSARAENGKVVVEAKIKRGAKQNGSSFESRQGSRGHREGGPEAHGRLLPLSAGADRGQQVHVQGIPGPDRRSEFQGVLPLLPVL